jgi:hypothetical protein
MRRKNKAWAPGDISPPTLWNYIMSQVRILWWQSQSLRSRSRSRSQYIYFPVHCESSNIFPLFVNEVSDTECSCHAVGVLVKLLGHLLTATRILYCNKNSLPPQKSSVSTRILCFNKYSLPQPEFSVSAGILFFEKEFCLNENSLFQREFYISTRILCFSKNSLFKENQQEFSA